MGEVSVTESVLYHVLAVRPAYHVIVIPVSVCCCVRRHARDVRLELPTAFAWRVGVEGCDVGYCETIEIRDTVPGAGLHAVYKHTHTHTHTDTHTHTHTLTHTHTHTHTHARTHARTHTHTHTAVAASVGS